MKNYYEILEVSENASPEVIEKAYKALVKKYHPDLQPEGQKQEAENKIKIINEAYDILSNTSKKETYDNQLKAERIKEEKAKYSQTTHTQPNTNTNTNININTHSNSQKRAVKPPQTTSTKPPQNSVNQNFDMDAFSQTINNAVNKAYVDAYNQAYINNLKSMGYEIVYEKTFKERIKSFFAVIFAIIVLIIICVILWHIPPIKSYFINLYNNNELVKVLADFIHNIFSNLISLFKK